MPQSVSPRPPLRRRRRTFASCCTCSHASNKLSRKELPICVRASGVDDDVRSRRSVCVAAPGVPRGWAPSPDVLTVDARYVRAVRSVLGERGAAYRLRPSEV